MTFEYRHENKSCSACLKDQFASFASLQVLQNIPGSQLLSDVQTFFLTAGFLTGPSPVSEPIIELVPS